MTYSPKEFTENVLKLTGVSVTEQTMKRVIIEAIEKWESYKENKDFPEHHPQPFAPLESRISKRS